MSFFPEDIIKSELRHDEELLWCGMPNPSEMAKKGSPLTVFGIFFTSIALFMFIQAVSFAPIFFNVMPFLFVIIGIAVTLTPLWIYKKAKKTYYGISNKRCIIIQANKYKNVQSYDIENVKILNKLEKLDGSGTIIFAKELSESYSSDTHRTRTTSKNIGFYGIPNVRDVENIINSVISGNIPQSEFNNTTQISKDYRDDSVSY